MEQNWLIHDGTGSLLCSTGWYLVVLGQYNLDLLGINQSINQYLFLDYTHKCYWLCCCSITVNNPWTVICKPIFMTDQTFHRNRLMGKFFSGRKGIQIQICNKCYSVILIMFIRHELPFFIFFASMICEIILKYFSFRLLFDFVESFPCYVPSFKGK